MLSIVGDFIDVFSTPNEPLKLLNFSFQIHRILFRSNYLRMRDKIKIKVVSAYLQ